MIPNILMQSTSVDVVSVNPAADAEPAGQALKVSCVDGAVCGSVTVPALGTTDGAAPAVLGTRAVTALSVATASSNPSFFFMLVSISPPCCGYIGVGPADTRREPDGQRVRPGPGSGLPLGQSPRKASVKSHRSGPNRAEKPRIPVEERPRRPPVTAVATGQSNEQVASGEPSHSTHDGVVPTGPMKCTWTRSGPRWIT